MENYIIKDVLSINQTDLSSSLYCLRILSTPWAYDKKESLLGIYLNQAGWELLRST